MCSSKFWGLYIKLFKSIYSGLALKTPFTTSFSGYFPEAESNSRAVRAWVGTWARSGAQFCARWLLPWRCHWHALQQVPCPLCSQGMAGQVNVKRWSVTLLLSVCAAGHWVVTWALPAPMAFLKEPRQGPGMLASSISDTYHKFTSFKCHL